MNKYVILLVLSLLFSGQLYAQKFGYIDADYILTQMPAYLKAQNDIQESASKWQTDIEAKLASVDDMRDDFQAEEILLTEEMKKERLDEIEKKAKEVRDYQKRIFGYQGLFFTRKQELMKPAMEELQKAVEKIARREKLQFVFTNTEGVTIIYAEQRHDYTEEVLEELGLKENEESPEKGNQNNNTEKGTQNKDNPNPTKTNPVKEKSGNGTPERKN